MAAHYRAFPGGNPVGYQEVGNEPDNRDFFIGGRDAYLNLYRLGSKAIRDGDPDAVVGGPALAFSSRSAGSSRSSTASSATTARSTSTASTTTPAARTPRPTWTASSARCGTRCNATPSCGRPSCT